MSMEEKKQRGGRRPGSGRPQNDRKVMLCVRITPEAAAIINEQKNKSEFIDKLIKSSV